MTLAGCRTGPELTIALLELTTALLELTTAPPELTTAPLELTTAPLELTTLADFEHGNQDTRIDEQMSQDV